ncbi:hypothetical protein DFP72DRAFT_853264 [Ephemerocybe angulata]|uniref:Uncharacterized protein n=1 Tax=Ephemerocybe angulata TaxID=980116 RepID=A0A8H6HKC0_9AGAR|nr:hypothetical protein DFP72DRAFT_853264 [Tulosesus angulatus]
MEPGEIFESTSVLTNPTSTQGRNKENISLQHSQLSDRGGISNQAPNATAQRLIEDLQRKNDDLKTRLQGSDALTTKLQEKCTTLDTELKWEKATTDSMTKKLREKGEAMEALQTQHAELVGKCAEWEKKTKAGFERLKSEAKAHAERQLSNLRQEHERQMGDMKARIKSADNEIKLLQSQLSKCHQEKADREAALEVLEGQVKGAKAAAKDEEAKATKRLQQKHERHIAKEKQKITDLQAQLDTKTKLLDAKSSIVQDLERARTAAVEENAAWRKECEELKQLVEEWERKNDAGTAYFNEAKESAEFWRKKYEALESQNGPGSMQVAGMRLQLEKEQTELGDMRRRYSEMESGFHASKDQDVPALQFAFEDSGAVRTPEIADRSTIQGEPRRTATARNAPKPAHEQDRSFSKPSNWLPQFARRHPSAVIPPFEFKLSHGDSIHTWKLMNLLLDGQASVRRVGGPQDAESGGVRLKLGLESLTTVHPSTESTCRAIVVNTKLPTFGQEVEVKSTGYDERLKFALSNVTFSLVEVHPRKRAKTLERIGLFYNTDLAVVNMS